MELVEWLKERFGVITQGDLRKYREDIRYPELHTDAKLYNRKVIRREERILRKIFSYLNSEEPFIHGLLTMHSYSTVFEKIVRDACKSAIDEHGTSVKEFFGYSSNIIIKHSSQQKSNILSSLVGKGDTFEKTMQLSLDLPITEGNKRYTIREQWERFFRMLG